MEQKKRIAIIGGGPSGLFMFKRLVESGKTNLVIDVYEKTDQLGCGMPYSALGANEEHITNVSANEIPDIVTNVKDWLETAAKTSADYDRLEHFNEYKVLPRLLFGQYLSAQFGMLLAKANFIKLEHNIYLNAKVIDIIDDDGHHITQVVSANRAKRAYDHVIICTGHYWPSKYENATPGFFDSPYPPSKLRFKCNHTVAIRGSSLTAVDAIRTLARQNGIFDLDKNSYLEYRPLDECDNFKIILHTRHGLLPAVRFHLEDAHLRNDSLLTPEEIKAHMLQNNGFLSLDYIFDNDFKNIFLRKDPNFYQRIKDMDVEGFVSHIMETRAHVAPFDLLQAEYIEAKKSIRRKESIYWKEMLGILSFAMNYPAKHMSAEDMLRLKKVLLPLISIVIAYIPQTSTLELLAMHKAGVLDIVAVGNDSFIHPAEQGGAVYEYTDEDDRRQSVHYETFIDCIGQPHLGIADFPFRSMVKQEIISQARLPFKSTVIAKQLLDDGNDLVELDGDGYYLQVDGIAINDNFQVVDKYGAYNERIYIAAVPFIGGYNPDYSGLDFCEAASDIITKSIFAHG